MIVTTVTTNLKSRGTGDAVWFAMIFPQDTIAEVYAELALKGCVYGHRLHTERSGSRTVEKKREPMVLGVGAVATIRPTHLSVDLSERPSFVGGSENG